MYNTYTTNIDNPKPLILWQAHEGNLSGANIAMLEYIDALSETYRANVILPHKGSMYKALMNRDVPVMIVPQYTWSGTISLTSFTKRLKRFIRTIMAVAAVKELLKKTRPVLVFTNTLLPFVSAKAAFKMGIPHVWWIHEYGEEDFGLKIGYGKPVKAYKKIQQWSRLVICNSKAVAKKFKALLPDVDVECVYQPVSWNTIEKPSDKPVASGYLMFGQPTSTKGHLDVLKAVAKAKQLGVDVELSIKGPCEQLPYLEKMQKFIEEHHLHEHVNVETGFFVREKVLPQFKTLIIASHSEAFGRVIVEATKAGLYSVVKNSGGAPELINSSNGIIYNTTDELCDIFIGKIPLPVSSPLLSYNSECEIIYLKQLLLAIL